MFLRVFTFLICLALWSVPVAAAVITTDSTISEVTVYRQGALVTRTATVALPAGTSQLEVLQLPPGLDARQLRLSVDNAGVTLGQIRLRRQELGQAFNAEVNALNEQLAQARLNLQAVEDSDRTAQLQLKFLEGLAKGYSEASWTGAVAGGGNSGSWTSALQALAAGDSAARKTLRNNVLEKQKLKAEVDRLQRELNQLNNRSRQSQTLAVDVAAASAGTAQLTVSYIDNAASWQPRYEARLNSQSASLSLVQKAQVRQWSSERWTNVALTLSTNAPSGAMQAPEVPSTFLNMQGYEVARPVAMAMEEVRVSAAKARRQADYLAADEAAPVVDVGSFSVTYELPGRVSVSNQRNEPELFDLTATPLQPQLVTRVAPQFSNEAFLTAKLTYNADLPLAASNMSIYVDGEFAGETQIEEILPGQEVVLPMGVDRRVAVQVQYKGAENSESGLLSRRKSETTNIQFSVTNRRGSPTLVEVYDRIPVSEDEDIEVSVPKTATPPTERDADGRPGVVVWRETLASGESLDIKHQYTVSYPADKRIRKDDRF